MQGEMFTFSTIAALAFIHTALGPDHYLPFIAMSRSAGWSTRKTAGLTFVCGLGHVISSVIIGIFGLAFGLALYKLEAFQEFRGEIAAWLLMAFGLGYFLIGVFSRKNHSHIKEESAGEKKSLTPWILFTIFVFGPCEVLIPMLMYYGAHNDVFSMVTASIIFGVITILTMMVIVLLTLSGIRLIRVPFLEKHSRSLAGLVIFLSGAGIQFLGL